MVTEILIHQPDPSSSVERAFLIKVILKCFLDRGRTEYILLLVPGLCTNPSQLLLTPLELGAGAIINHYSACKEEAKDI